MQLKPLILLASSIAVAWGATVANVLTDLGNVKTQLTTLDNAIKAFPNSGGSLAAALVSDGLLQPVEPQVLPWMTSQAIHTDATNTQSAVDKTTSDANTLPIPVTETDGQSILSAVQGIEPIILSTLTDIVTKKAAFQALPIGGIPALVKQDLTNLNASTSALETALISRAPADLVNNATTIKNQINSAFAVAIAAYA